MVTTDGHVFERRLIEKHIEVRGLQAWAETYLCSGAVQQMQHMRPAEPCSQCPLTASKWRP